MGLVSTSGSFSRECPDQSIFLLQKEGDYEKLIETGTFYGAASKWASAHFSKVITFEASEEIFKKQSFTDYLNGISVFGDLSTLIADYLSEPSIIYLDAHTRTEESFDSNPAIEELKLINHSGNHHCIIVDDARCCTAAWDSFSYGELVDLIPLLGAHNRYVVVFDDVTIAVPRSFKELPDVYSRKRASRYWRVYVQELEERDHPFRTAAKNGSPFPDSESGQVISIECISVRAVSSNFSDAWL
jgi:hypothetical protein